MTDVSIIVPFYKGNAHMERLFQVVRKNAAAAPELHMELLLVNDSPDHPVIYQPDWVQGFSLRILDNPKNVGIHNSRINGIRAAQGTFIQMLDQDDLLVDHAIASQVATIGNFDIVVANGVDQGGGHPGKIYTSVAQQQLVMERRFYYTVGCMIASPGQCLIRRDAIPHEWMERPIQRNGADDLLLWLLMLQGKHRWTINPEVLYTHVITGENLSADFDRMQNSAFEVKDMLLQYGLLSPRELNWFLRRFRMRRSYEQKGTVHKLLAMLYYPDLSVDLIRKKLLGRQG